MTPTLRTLARRKGMQQITVAVFNQYHWSAYTCWYNPSWPGCCLHEVNAQNGTAAKKIALTECKAHRSLYRGPDVSIPRPAEERAQRKAALETERFTESEDG